LNRGIDHSAYEQGPENPVDVLGLGFGQASAIVEFSVAPHGSHPTGKAAARTDPLIVTLVFGGLMLLDGMGRRGSNQ
jgi:hypothetical protein